VVNSSTPILVTGSRPFDNDVNVGHIRWSASLHPMTTEQRDVESNEGRHAPKPRSAAVEDWIESCLVSEAAGSQNGFFLRWRRKLSRIGASTVVADRLSPSRLSVPAFLILGSVAGGLTFLVASELGVPLRDAALIAGSAVLLTPGLAIVALRAVHLLFRIMIVVGAAALTGGAIWLAAHMLFGHQWR
jgi:hypothetical protein